LLYRQKKKKKGISTAPALRDRRAAPKKGRGGRESEIGKDAGPGRGEGEDPHLITPLTRPS